jgi:hypothetical protein
MNEFVQRHASKVIGMLCGFDRILFRGTLRRLANVGGMSGWLWVKRVLLKEFGAWSEELTAAVRERSESVVRAAGRPMRYVNDSSLSKEALAREIADRDGIRNGLVCQFSAVEPCWSYDIYRNRSEKKLQLVARQRKCLHLYHYFVDEEVGFGHVRLQTWLPFNVKVCLNGREWLGRQMEKAGIGYMKRDNCFTRVSDVQGAQALLDEQLKTDWVKLLERLRELVLPGYQGLLGSEAPEYYWSMDQSEWASDVMFKHPEDLTRLYPELIGHGMRTLGSREVMRFLGKRVAAEGRPIRGNDEVVSDLRERIEGVRLKHRVNNNSVKMYDKQGSVLRVETTINEVRGFRVYRGTEAEPDKKRWRHLRKGVADVHRRAQVSQACNQRYLAMLASVEQETKLGELLDPLCRRGNLNGQKVRGLRPFDEPDRRLLATIGRGEFMINGLRNRDLREHLYGKTNANDKKEQRRQAAAITRQLRILRGHGLINKVNRTHRYQLSEKGRQLVTALAGARVATTKDLIKLAA